MNRNNAPSSSGAFLLDGRSRTHSHALWIENFMKRVTGIGGIFFKAQDAPALREWYQCHLGIDVQFWGGTSERWLNAESMQSRVRGIHVPRWKVQDIDTEEDWLLAEYKYAKIHNVPV